MRVAAAPRNQSPPRASFPLSLARPWHNALRPPRCGRSCSRSSETFAQRPASSQVRPLLLPLPVGEGWGEGLPGNPPRITQRSLLGQSNCVARQTPMDPAALAPSPLREKAGMRVAAASSNHAKSAATRRPFAASCSRSLWERVGVRVFRATVPRVTQRSLLGQSNCVARQTPMDPAALSPSPLREKAGMRVAAASSNHAKSAATRRPFAASCSRSLWERVGVRVFRATHPGLRKGLPCGRGWD